MPTWLKILLAVIAAGALCVVALAGGAYWWFTANKDRIAERGESAKADAERFAATHDGTGCVEESLERLEAADGLVEEAVAKHFLARCLERARPAPGLCDGVPRRSEMLQSAAWALTTCTERGQEGSRPCTRMVAAIQEHCDRQLAAR